MNVFIVGLGLIGASYAEGLVKKGYHVFGYDHDESVLKRAISYGLIDPSSSLSSISSSDLVILALYPHDNIEFVQKNHHLFHQNQLITDVSGTKVDVVKGIESILNESIAYTSHHPMAGKETKGIESRDYKIFKGANFLIVNTKRSKLQDEEILKRIANDLGFKHTLTTSPKEHDQLIAFTSQLTHILAVGLVNSDAHEHTKFATGDSYRDLTRIAKINEILWSELFIENKVALIERIEAFESSINALKEMILNDDLESLKNALKKAKEKRESFDVY
jgi:prephenate dehydrogenase